MESPISATMASLDALQSAEQQNVLNVVDSLRECGIDDVVPLLQLVVCGDQLSGKSSVLEAITEIPFPRGENLCSRFATEIVLPRLPESFITTKIIPDKARPAKEQAELTNFKLSIKNFDELSDLIESATKAMGIGDRNNGNTLMWTELPAAHSRRSSRTHPLRERVSKLGRCNIGLGTSGTI